MGKRPQSFASPMMRLYPAGHPLTGRFLATLAVSTNQRRPEFVMDFTSVARNSARLLQVDVLVAKP